MFCGHCGSRIPENAFNCPACGRPAPTQPAQQPGNQAGYGAAPYGQQNPYGYGAQPVQPQGGQYQAGYAAALYNAPHAAPYGYGAAATAPKRTNWPLIIGIIVGICAVIVVLLVVAKPNFGGGFSSTAAAEQVVQESFDSAMKLDTDTYIATWHPKGLEIQAKNNGMTLEQYKQALTNNATMSKTMMDALGMDLSNLITFETTSATPITGAELESLREKWNSVDPGLGNEFQEAVDVNVTLSISDKVRDMMGQFGGASMPTSITGTETCVKIGGNWYIIDESADMSSFYGMM